MTEPVLLTSPASKVKGVGDKTASLLSKLGIKTVFDLITYYPRSYENRTNIRTVSDCIDGERVGVFARLAVSPNNIRVKNNITLTKMLFADDTGAFEATFFNQPYLKTSYKVGDEYFVFGKFSKQFGKHEMISPVIEKASVANSHGAILPLYPLTEGLSQNKIRKAVNEALKLLPDGFETLPTSITAKYSLIPFSKAIALIHNPKNDFEIALSRERLIFEELFVLRSGILRIKMLSENAGKNEHPLICNSSVESFISSLPYTLTDAQKRVLNECLNDISSGKRMRRLIQGDVGSGKTVVAAAIAFAVAISGGQSAIMAPTEILSEQHYANIGKMMAPFGIKTVLLTGSTSKKDREKILSGLSDGTIQICIGTHALLTGNIVFKNLAFVTTDEQHRFGVMQRSALSDKGAAVHLLVMSATPIPRTVGLVIYGGLDISVIDELPAGRKKIKTVLIDSTRRKDAYEFAKKELDAGHQVYVVCPAIDSDGLQDLTSVNDLFDDLTKGYLKGYKVSLLHGKMSATDKKNVMDEFYSGKTQVIVSTTVIEVGIDSPNASLIFIENAERFGLSQLHQLRGRVGRGSVKSYCILISDNKNDSTVSRLETVRDNDDGFKLMEYDLRERGPGDFFGKRQHGLPSLKIADLAVDVSIMNKASEAAENLFNGTVILNKSDKQYLRNAVNKLFSDNYKDIFS